MSYLSFLYCCLQSMVVYLILKSTSQFKVATFQVPSNHVSTVIDVHIQGISVSVLNLHNLDIHCYIPWKKSVSTFCGWPVHSWSVVYLLLDKMGGFSVLFSHTVGPRFIHLSPSRASRIMIRQSPSRHPVLAHCSLSHFFFPPLPASFFFLLLLVKELLNPK